MSWAGTRFGVGTRLIMDGEAAEIVQLAATRAGNEVIVKDSRGRILRISQRELLLSEQVRVIPDGKGPASDDACETAGTVLTRRHSAAARWERAELAVHTNSPRRAGRGGGAARESRVSGISRR